MTAPETSEPAVRACPYCRADLPDLDLNGHLNTHLGDGSLTIVQSATRTLWVDTSSGVAVWDEPRPDPTPSRAPTGIAITMFPRTRTAGISILIGVIPALVAGAVFFWLTEPQPYLEWAAGPCAAIIVMRGVRRFSARILIKRFLGRNPGPCFIGEPVPAKKIKAGSWVRTSATHAARVVSVLDDTDMPKHTVTLVFIDGATVTFHEDEPVLSGLVVRGRSNYPTSPESRVSLKPQRRGE